MKKAEFPSGLFQFYFEQRLRNHVHVRGNQTGMLHVYMNSLLDIREGTFSSIDRIAIGDVPPQDCLPSQVLPKVRRAVAFVPRHSGTLKVASSSNC